jgi:hypothetical protein
MDFKSLGNHVNAVPLLMNRFHQDNWIRINLALFKIGLILQPGFFANYGWMQDSLDQEKQINTKSERTHSIMIRKDNKKQKYTSTDYLAHMCDLMRV